ncbi:phage tail tape measure protein [Sphingomonas immobilis]|uniref:Phage tail tape measure protein domain-containing protein n=1 Tax=Sphingomonas immobilis TaxID=3063997 RepID=A0ABT8ZU28_9SPHN|nr:phage tail tape measure protein [Sphingomonas sp. CA1-15]MDO7841075.1 hypothetical protein [Sphingomonas sp. CA1-15]
MAGGDGLIGALRVTLGIDTANFESGTKRARDIAKRDAASIQSTMQGLSASVKGLVAGATVTALIGAASRALDYASSLGEVSQQLGVTSKDLQVYRYAASQVGIEQDTMDASLAKLTKTIGEAADGSKAQATTFRDLGIAVKDASGRVYTAGEIIPRLADALSKVKDPATRARVETELFGRAGQKLDTLLAGGSAAIDDMAKTVDKLGLALSDEQIQNADKTADKLSELKQVLQASFAKVVAENATSLYNFADAIEHLIAKIPDAVRGLDSFFQRLKIVQSQAIFASPLSTQTAKVESLAVATMARNKLARNDITDQLAKAPDNVRGALAKLLPKQFGEEFGLYRDQRKTAPKVLDGALPTPRGGGAKSGEKDKSAKQQERYDRELAALTQDQYRTESDLSNSLVERANLERRRIDLAAQAYDDEQDSKAKLGELKPEQANRLKIAHAFNVQMEKELVEQRLSDDLNRESLQARDEALKLQADLKNGELGEAKTQKERRRLQLDLLDIEFQRQRAALESVLALNSSTDAEKQIAQARLDQLDKMQATATRGVTRETMSPLEKFRDELHRTAGQISEDFEQIEVDGLKTFNDGLVDAITNGKSLGDVLHSALNQVLGDLIKISLQSLEGGILGGGSGGSGLLSGLLGSIFGGGKSFAATRAASFSLPGFAAGGSFKVGGNKGVDRNVLSINGIPAVRVGANETVSVTPANENGSGPGGMRYYDFRGVQSADIPRLEAMINKLDRSIEPRSVAAAGDARARRIIR